MIKFAQVVMAIAILLSISCKATVVSTKLPDDPETPSPTKPPSKAVVGSFVATQYKNNGFSFPIVGDTSQGLFIATTSTSLNIGGGGILKYDQATQTWVQTNIAGRNFSEIKETDQGVFATLVCSGGILKWNTQTGKWDQSLAPSEWFAGVSGTKEGTFAYGNAVRRYNPAKGSWDRVSIPAKTETVMTISGTSAGAYIGSGSNTGIFSYDPQTSTFSETNIKSLFIGNIVETSSGIFAGVFGNAEHGIRKLDTTSGTWINTPGLNQYMGRIKENSLGIFAKVNAGTGFNDVYQYDTATAAWTQVSKSLYSAIKVPTNDIYRSDIGIEKKTSNSWTATNIVDGSYDLAVNNGEAFAIHTQTGAVLQLNNLDSWQTIFTPSTPHPVQFISSQWGVFVKDGGSIYRFVN